MPCKMLCKEVQQFQKVPDLASIWVQFHSMHTISTWILPLGLSLYKIMSNSMISLKQSFIRTGILLSICQSNCECLSRSWEFYTRQTRSNFAHTILYLSHQAGGGSHDSWQSNQQWSHKIHCRCSNSPNWGSQCIWWAWYFCSINQSDHEPQGSLQGYNHLLSVLNLHNEAERNMGPNFGFSSRGRQWTMSHQIQDANSQGSLIIFNKAMYVTALCDQSIFFGNDFDVPCQNVCTILLPSMFEMLEGIIYLHQALKQDNSEEFIMDAVKEVNDHIEQKHWRLMEQSKVPDGVMPLSSVWAMRYKHNLTTNEINKYRAWPNVHGRKQEAGLQSIIVNPLLVSCAHYNTFTANLLKPTHHAWTY